eukprot:COSAG02_NODE_7921_length_2785_cov_1.825763_5_plen_132_part_00
MRSPGVTWPSDPGESPLTTSRPRSSSRRPSRHSRSLPAYHGHLVRRDEGSTNNGCERKSRGDEASTDAHRDLVSYVRRRGVGAPGGAGIMDDGARTDSSSCNSGAEVVSISMQMVANSIDESTFNQIASKL